MIKTDEVIEDRKNTRRYAGEKRRKAASSKGGKNITHTLLML